jgi:hypothetical protein
LWWKDAMEVIQWKIESPQVSEIANRRGDGAKKLELCEVQRHHAATTASFEATLHASPLADGNR